MNKIIKHLHASLPPTPFVEKGKVCQSFHLDYAIVKEKIKMYWYS